MGSLTWLMVVIGICVMGLVGNPARRSVSPDERMRLLLNDEDRSTRRGWTRPWMVDQPSHLTPDRVHGGIGP